MDDLLNHAAGLGLRVQFRDLGRVRNGEIHSSGLVVINDRRTVATQRITLAHECGHHVHGHDWTTRHDRDRDEREADTYAARLLISPEALAEAEALVGCRDSALARELNVQAKHIALWRASYLKEVGVIRRKHLRAVG
ncbi:ImmA/IrrE family metallo-endopeptidase [Cellulomonas sp.]|uniref:ImmA/IrrE family metallo-endopeptidase n=1 Tax=Cellulomonas sp. TaxID=40001 RepID=UPI001B156187|nr:ImmA/IrrE family metallo-endopeptidase [Cellulomonas sp.]MBO9555546.1 ImmA/IrrE family metallo-endopeptidase [Cellulomonas sp.]